MNRKIINLYEHYKNTEKKLRIVCDWDEVIQACEPYALWLAKKERADNGKETFNISFNTSFLEQRKRDGFFKEFWDNELVKYSPYGSRLLNIEEKEVKGFFSQVALEPLAVERQQVIKNSPNFYQQAPFLTIAEDLLKLIKKNKVEKLIFLSAYDKRKFPNGDERKYEMFRETFGKLLKVETITGEEKSNEKQKAVDLLKKHNLGKIAEGEYTYQKETQICSLKLIPFDSETQGQSKADWIKENDSDFDIVIDDNPNICKSVVESKGNSILVENGEGELIGSLDDKETKEHLKKQGIDYKKMLRVNNKMVVLSPYYPAVENQHHLEVLLVNNEVSELRGEDFN